MNLQEYFKSNNYRKANEYKLTTEIEPSGGVRVVLMPINTGRDEDVQHFNAVANHMTFVGTNLYKPEEPEAPGKLEPEAPQDGA